MAKQNQLTLKLADGRQKSFDNGCEMLVWFNCRKGIRVGESRNATKNTGNRTVRGHTSESGKTTVRIHQGLNSFLRC